MLSEDEKDQIREVMDALKSGVEGFSSRRPQLEMIATVATTLAACRIDDEAPRDGRNIAMIEAGTGTGKSFGALVPAIVLAKSRRRRLVVSSSTVALQHQYAEKDAPALQGVSPVEFTFAVAKGRRRYACTTKLLGEAGDAGQHEIEMDDDASAAPETAAVRRRRTIVIQLAEDFETGRWNGDRDELPVPVTDDVWRDLSTDRQGCAVNRCPEFARCPFYEAKQRVRAADVVIANHDLVLAALAMESSSVLPPASETIYVFDEAHTLAAKAIEHLSAKHALRGPGVAARYVGRRSGRRPRLQSRRRAAAQRSRQRRPAHGGVGGTQSQDHRSARLRREAGAALQGRCAAGVDARRRGRHPTPCSVPAGDARGGARSAARARRIRGFDGHARSLRRWLPCRQARQPAGYVGAAAARGHDVDDAPVARWIERQAGAAGDDVHICAAPISGSDELRRVLWNRTSAAVLMSGTLTSSGTFDLFVRQTGLVGYPSLNLLRVDSPFDYRANAKLVIPAMRTSPTEPAAHTNEVIARMPELINTRGTLVLFASGKQMRDVYGSLDERLRRITLVQGTMPKMEMLVRHRAAIDRGESSVLFGLQSLAEGVDLPRDYCSHVICVKPPESSARDSGRNQQDSVM